MANVVAFIAGGLFGLVVGFIVGFALFIEVKEGDHNDKGYKDQ